MERGPRNLENSKSAAPDRGLQSSQQMRFQDPFPLCEDGSRLGPGFQADHVQSPYLHTDLPTAANAFASVPDNANTAITSQPQGPDPLRRYLADHFETPSPSAIIARQQCWLDGEGSQTQSSSSMARSTASSLYGPASWTTCSVPQLGDLGGSKLEFAPPMRLSLSESVIPRIVKYETSDFGLGDIGFSLNDPLQCLSTEVSTLPFTSHPRSLRPVAPTTSGLASRSRKRTRYEQQSGRPYKQAPRQGTRQSQSLSPCTGPSQRMLTGNSTFSDAATGGDYFSALGSSFQDPSFDFDWLSPVNLAAFDPSSLDLSNLQPLPGVTPDPPQNFSISWPQQAFGHNIKMDTSLGQPSSPLLSSFPSLETPQPQSPLPTSLTVFRPRPDRLTVPSRPSHTRRSSEPTPSKKAPRGIRMNKSLSSPASALRRCQPICTSAPAAEEPATKAIGPDIPGIKLKAPPRGRRNGPMQEDKKKKARKTRNNRSMCIGCKISKVLCDIPEGSDTCLKCSKITPDSRLPYVCTRAYFLDIVKSGTTNYISQYSINHIRRNLFQRKSIALPLVLDFDDFLPDLDSRGQQYDIGVSQGDSQLFVLDLQGCHSYLNGLLPGLQNPSQSFRGFIDSQLNKFDKWSKCLKDTEALQDQNLLKTLVVWNNMPSRVDYTLVPKSGGAERLLDPDDQNDEQTLFIAAQLSRIVNRKLEILAYKDLQQRLNGNSTMEVAHLVDLAELLLSLRWRLSWWSVIGLGIAIQANPAAEQREKEAFKERVQSLCRILYFYYRSMVRRLPSYTDLTRLQRRMIHYPDTERPIWEDFPRDESVEGFEAWMQQGEDKIKEAGTRQHISIMSSLPIVTAV